MKLVAAIMPTRARREWAAQALQSFLSQDYPNKILVALDDSTEPSFPDGIESPIVLYVRHSSRRIDEKRNLCCEMADDAEVIMHFDSDDWSAPSRMSDQIRRMEESGKAVTGYDAALFRVEPSGPWRKWTSGDRKGFVLGTSLAYTREWWKHHPFEQMHHNCGEDNQMVGFARDENQLSIGDGVDFVFARIHSGNTSPKDCSPWRIQHAPLIEKLWLESLGG